MGRCIAELPHECGTEFGLRAFEREDGTVDGFCFRCHKYVRHPFGKPMGVEDVPAPKRKLGLTEEELAEAFAEIAECKAVDLVDRRLRADCLDYYGIKIGMDRATGKKPELHYYPYTKRGKIARCKVRLIENKRMWSIGNEKDVDLFGWEQAVASGAKRLLIVEGELDCPALKRIIDIHTKPEFDQYKPAVVSLINGSKSAGKDLARLAPKIRKHFKEEDISFVYDDDESGEHAVEDSIKVFPNATSVTLPSNDANACILEGTTRGAFNAVMFKAEKPKNSRLVSADDLFEEAKVPAELGVSWPWAVMTDMTRGIRTGETIYIAAGEKMGKSEIVNALAAHLIKEHGWKVFLAKPEEALKKTVKMLANKMVGSVFTDPHIPFDESAYNKACDLMKGKVKLLGVYQHVTWEVLRADICAAAAWGTKAVFIDPLTCLTNGMSSTERNDKLMGIGQELAALALDLDIVIFIFAHLNKPAQGATPWDRGGKITTNYFAGSSGMARSCNYAIGLEGNKDPELSEDERNIRKLGLLADREFGESGYCNLYWNKANHMFSQI